MNAQTDYVTKNDLEKSLEKFGKSLMKQFDAKLDAKLDSKLDARFALQAELFRDELDSKLAAQETRLKLHTEEVVGHHSAELLENIASVVQPLEKRTRRLEVKVFGRAQGA